MEQTHVLTPPVMDSDSGNTVLLVDDELNVLRSLRRVLRDDGYRVLTAQSGPEALEILAGQKVALIVSDQRMVPMSGIEFLERARELQPEALRILLTGFSDLATIEDAINRVEIYRFLNKPWNDADLRSTIREAVDKHCLEEENRRLYATIESQNRELTQWADKLERLVEDRTRQLKDAQAQLVQSEKMASLGTLAGGVAHEINNPLGGILGIAQVLLSEHHDDPQLTQDLKVIEQAVLHCSGIVKNLLAFSRKSDPAGREKVEFVKLLDQVVLLVGHIFRHNNIEIVKKVPMDFPALRANPTQFQQVMLNLLVNAQQAMGNDGMVTVIASADQMGVSIEVRDQGPGIAEEIKDKIFDPFFTTKPEGQGTGLGLSVVYRIVEEHGGRIQAENLPGQGFGVKMVFGTGIIAAEPDRGNGNGPAGMNWNVIALNEHAAVL